MRSPLWHDQGCASQCRLQPSRWQAVHHRKQALKEEIGCLEPCLEKRPPKLLQTQRMCTISSHVLATEQPQPCAASSLSTRSIYVPLSACACADPWTHPWVTCRSLGYQQDSVLYDYYKPGRHAIKMLADLEQLGLR